MRTLAANIPTSFPGTFKTCLFAKVYANVVWWCADPQPSDLSDGGSASIVRRRCQARGKRCDPGSFRIAKIFAFVTDITGRLCLNLERTAPYARAICRVLVVCGTAASTESIYVLSLFERFNRFFSMLTH
jgi:hypothetical protein